MAYRTRFEPPSHSRNETKNSYPVKVVTDKYDTIQTVNIPSGSVFQRVVSIDSFDVIPCLVEAQKECKNCGAPFEYTKCKYCGTIPFCKALRGTDNKRT